MGRACISGNRGSGTVFFFRLQSCGVCSVRMAPYLPDSVGRPVTTERLAQIFLELEEQNAANINLVTLDHFL